MLFVCFLFCCITIVSSVRNTTQINRGLSTIDFLLSLSDSKTNKYHDLKLDYYLYMDWFHGIDPRLYCGLESIPLPLDRYYTPCVITSNDVSNNQMLTKLDRLRSFNECSDPNSLWYPNSQKWVALYLHGYRTNALSARFGSIMKNLLLANRQGREYGMFILLDWGNAVKNRYPEAMENTVRVASKIMDFFTLLMSRFPGIRPERIHLLGFSLGAHLAGFIGKNFQKQLGTIGRITGFDPAKPGYDDAPISARLHRNDALFVDIIHTNSKEKSQFSLGVSKSVGHLDFYPNGGVNQPGCHISFFTFFKIQYWANFTHFLKHKDNAPVVLSDSCDHSRSPKLFIRSIPRIDADLEDGAKWCGLHSFKCGIGELGRTQCQEKFTKNRPRLELNGTNIRNRQYYLFYEFEPEYHYDDESGDLNESPQLGFFAYKWAEKNPNYREMDTSHNYYIRTFKNDPICSD